MPLGQLLENVRSSLWFVPGLCVAAATVAAFLMLRLDEATPQIGTDYPLIFGGGSDGARGLLSAIAGSIITVAGVVFSITIIALQLASSQYSPRVLRNFMRDTSSQLTLGALLGTFVFSMLVLRAVRAADDEGRLFIPGMSITLAVLLTLVAVGFLVYFIHHIATKIQLATIAESVAAEGRRAIENLWAEHTPEEVELEAVLPAGEPPAILDGTKSGYLQLIETDELTKLAAERGIVLRLEHVPGDWVSEGMPLFAVWPATALADDLTDAVNSHVGIGKERSTSQDVGYAIRQLVDVAVRALSPSLNDPTSAVDCIHRLGDLLLLAGTRHPPGAIYRDSHGDPRLVVAYAGFATLLDVAFDEIRRNGGSQPRIVIELARILEMLRRTLPPEHHAALAEHAELLVLAATQIEPDRDRRPILEALGSLHDPRSSGSAS